MITARPLTTYTPSFQAGPPRPRPGSDGQDSTTTSPDPAGPPHPARTRTDPGTTHAWPVAPHGLAPWGTGGWPPPPPLGLSLARAIPTRKGNSGQLLVVVVLAPALSRCRHDRPVGPIDRWATDRRGAPTSRTPSPSPTLAHDLRPCRPRTSSHQRAIQRHGPTQVGCFSTVLTKPPCCYNVSSDANGVRLTWAT